MKRNCNLELRLVTPSVHFHSSDRRSMMEMVGGSPDEKQNLTIFYNGQITTCDVTEIQARTIICLAGRAKEEQKLMNGSDPTSPVVNSPLYSPATGLSMKRSLQRFLQKRKTRAQAISPYTIARHPIIEN